MLANKGENYDKEKESYDYCIFNFRRGHYRDVRGSDCGGNYGQTFKSQSVAQIGRRYDDIQNALWYSSIAANSHNTQMWSVKLYPKENRLQISIDESRVLNVVDSEKREAYISLGCYIETMSVAFSAYGYDTQINCNDLSVQVAYQKRDNATVDTTKLSLIDKRHTDKSAYSNGKIEQKTVNALLNKYSALSVYQNGDENFDYIKRISMDAVTVQSANQAYRDELAEWMRFSDKEAASKLDRSEERRVGKECRL